LYNQWHMLTIYNTVNNIHQPYINHDVIHKTKTKIFKLLLLIYK
jgi:hypothetical protein